MQAQKTYDPSFNVIDATIVKSKDRFVMFLKDETRNPVQKNIKIAYSDKLTGPYTKASLPITGNYWAEEPTILKNKTIGWFILINMGPYLQQTYKTG